jgi:hypothetical protein
MSSSTSQALSELKQAESMVASSKDAEFADLQSYDFKSNPPLAMAKLMSKTLKRPDGSYMGVADCFVLALHWFETGLNPYKGEIYMLPSGRIGESLQGKLKDAKREGYDLSNPLFEELDREWPKRNGKPLELIRKDKGKEYPFFLEREPGIKCILTVNGKPVEYSAWLTEWFMPSNPNWFDRAPHMLRIRSHEKAVSQATGIGVSEEISAATDPITTPMVTSEVKSPGSLPFTK